MEAATTYSPYGEVLEQSGTSGTVYGFTGEQQDGATGLLYLRARYYNNSLKVFQSRDPWNGTGWRPGTLNYYTYTYANPPNHTDPSGLDPWGCTTPACLNPNPRDLTLWLFREMKVNVNDPRLQNVRAANEAASTARDIGVGVLGCSSPTLAGAGLIIGAGATSVYVAAGLQYYALVADHPPWDFKHRIFDRLGPGITLCSTLGCRPDIEYSVPGNIHYGFVSIEAGYGRVLTHAGAAGAEMYDAFRDPESDYELLDNIGVYPDVGGLGFSINVGDDPYDHEAVQFGVYLYDRYGRSLTLDQFKRELGLYMNRFATDTPYTTAVPAYVASKWPYPVGYFDPTRSQ